MSKTVKIILIFLAVAILAYAGYCWYKKKQKKPATASQPSNIIDATTGKKVVSDLANGLEPDIVSSTPNNNPSADPTSTSAQRLKQFLTGKPSEDAGTMSV